MPCSLILATASLVSQVMALNSTYAYVPGFFVTDNPQADSNTIGAVSKMRLLEHFKP